MIALLALVTFVFVGHPASSLQATGIPVLMPRTLPAGTPGKVYAHVDTASGGAYVVQLDFTADCDGATACNIGTMEGGVTDPIDGSKSVQLANGIEAKFEPYACGASCGDSTLMFRYKGTTYRLGLKAASQADVVSAANSLFPPP
jgi:hypothetical protein